MNLRAPPYAGPTWAQRLPDALAKRRVIKPAVVCVYWGDKYDIEYVRRLHQTCVNNLGRAFDFYCISDNPDVEEFANRLVPPVDYATWWQKIGLFDAGIAAQLGERPVLYLDIDVVGLQGLGELLDYEIPADGLVMCENFGPNKPQCAHNSSAMLWVAGSCTSIAADFRPEYMRELHGDQCYIWRHHAQRIDNWPRELIVSYKYDIRGRPAPIPVQARLVVFHGDPKPHEVREPWVQQFWHAL